MFGEQFSAERSFEGRRVDLLGDIMLVQADDRPPFFECIREFFVAQCHIFLFVVHATISPFILLYSTASSRLFLAPVRKPDSGAPMPCAILNH